MFCAWAPGLLVVNVAAQVHYDVTSALCIPSRERASTATLRWYAPREHLNLAKLLDVENRRRIPKRSSEFTVVNR
jgi:hypothetical protein